MKPVSASELRARIAERRADGESIGFVPTMGALHKGHLSLMERARADNDAVVVSIFVNPLQFGPREDLTMYPRDPEGDQTKCRDVGVDYLFAPEVDEIYPDGAIETRVDPGRIGNLLEGQFRPGFFTGVATVCVKLFNLVSGDRAYFGRKDAQQLAVIKQVVLDLAIPMEIVSCPTIREPDGLAMSSRNAYLDEDERRSVVALSRALFEAHDLVLSGERDPESLKRLVEKRLSQEPHIALQYAEVVDPDTFEVIETIDKRVCFALAAFAGKTRLIDNVFIDPSKPEEK